MKSDSSNGSAEDEQKNLKNMLLTLIEKADFLVEEDLNALMGVLPDKDKLLLKVDSILGALGVQEEADIEKIFQHLTTNADSSAAAQGSEGEMVSSAEKRSKILKVSLRQKNDTLSIKGGSWVCRGARSRCTIPAEEASALWHL